MQNLKKGYTIDDLSKLEKQVYFLIHSGNISREEVTLLAKFCKATEIQVGLTIAMLEYRKMI